jgi:DNA-binding transcriptional LysR family regulator
VDRLQAMSTSRAVVEAASLSAAARRLKSPLTTVSRKISELESHLRTKLFNRSSRQLVVTDAGSSYLAACKLTLADVTEAERTASSPRAEGWLDVATARHDTASTKFPAELQARYRNLSLRTCPRKLRVKCDRGSRFLAC